MITQGRNQHEWGLVAQTHEPYLEVAYCPLCRQYTVDGSIPLTKKEARCRLGGLKLYEPDSNIEFSL